MPERKKTKPTEPKATKTKQSAKTKPAGKETSRKTGFSRAWSDSAIKGHVVPVAW